MAKKDNFSDKIKEGVSVQEIEDFAKKYTNEMFLVLAFVIACISSIFDFFTGPTFSIVCATIGAIVALLMPERIREIAEKISGFIHKKDKTTQIVVGIVRIVIAIFLPFILFAGIGLQCGIGFHTIESSSTSSEK